MSVSVRNWTQIMPGLHRSDPKTREGKYLVTRRDGTVPDWPWFVLGAKDKAAPWALRAYAVAAFLCRMDWAYVKDVWKLAGEFRQLRRLLGSGDPDAPGHRTDDPVTIAKMACGGHLLPSVVEDVRRRVKLTAEQRQEIVQSVRDMYGKEAPEAIKTYLESPPKCHYCDQTATKSVVWLKDKYQKPTRIKLPWCGCDLMAALKRFWDTPYQIHEGVDFEVAQL